MKISIVVDNYNYERYLAAAIDSALAQTHPDVEVIVVDDGSVDGSVDIMRAYGDRITPIVRANGGQGAALTEALGSVSGDVTIFLDADDLAAPDLAARVAGCFEAEPALARVQWPLQTIDAEGKPSGPLVPNPAMMPNGDLRSHVLRYRTHVWPAMSGNAYATWALRRLFPVPADFRLGADLWLAETTAVLGPVRSLPSMGGSYRVHGANNWSSDKLDVKYLHQKIEWTRRSHDHLKRLCDEMGIDCPADPTTALDVAFLGQRLASLRLDPQQHPLEGDRRLALTSRGIAAAIAHPHHTRAHKLKRVAWFCATGLGTRRTAEAAIRRFYFRPQG